MDTNRAIPAQISLMTFVRFFLILLGVYLLWVLRDIVLLLFLSMILAAAIGPWVSNLSRFRIPRPIGVLIVYSGIIVVIVAVILLLIPAVVREASSISNRFPEYYEKVTDFLSTKSALKDPTISFAQTNLSFLSHSVFAGLKGFGRGLTSFLLVLVITFYFTIDEANLRRFWIRLAPVSYQERLLHITKTAGERIGSWFRGQLILSGIIAIVTYATLLLIGIPDALLLALVAGVAAFVPFIGAAIGILPALFVALTISVTKALIVLAVTVALYQVAMNVLLPKFISKSVGLNPVVIILVMLLGSSLAGAIGLILAIPVASIIDTIIHEFRDRPNLA